MEKYINQSMKQVCAEIEARESWEDEQFMRELDAQLEQDLCPTEQERAWLYEDDPFKVI